MSPAVGASCRRAVLYGPSLPPHDISTDSGDDAADAPALRLALPGPACGCPLSRDGSCIAPARAWVHATICRHSTPARTRGLASAASSFRLCDPVLDLIKLPHRRRAELSDVLAIFALVQPAVVAPPVELHVAHPLRPHARARLSACETALARALTSAQRPRPGVAGGFGDLGRPVDSAAALLFPERRLVEYDCGKLQALAVLLRRLRAEGHRCLIFTQMTRVLDILEQFLATHGYPYLRLDGSTRSAPAPDLPHHLTRRGTLSRLSR